MRLLKRALWICALLATALLAVNPELWHEDSSEQHCAVCHVSHQPLLETFVTVYLERPAPISWHSTHEQFWSETHSPLIAISGRAPPAGLLS